MFANGANLKDAAAGAYDAYYLKAAQTLAATLATDPDGKITVRIGEEFNGNWMPWAAASSPEDFAATFRRIVDIYRSVSPNFQFEWNVNHSFGGMDPALAYPGDDYVDIIGMDFYYDKRWFSADPEIAWSQMVNARYGLQWHQDFAAAHGKPTAYSEWGVDTDNGGVFVAHAAEWFEQHNVLYQIYWNSRSAFDGRLDDETTSTADGFLSSFGPQAARSDNDTLVGTNGNDLLDGGTGADTMTGGLGDDIYMVDNADDRVVEGRNGGIDTVRATVSYRLSDNVENLELLGNGNSAGTGNALNNRITGNSGNNLLQGMDGDDILIGGAGNDTLEGGAGDDELEGGEGNDILAGHTGNDRLFGGNGNDTLTGGDGNDTLDGGAGNDSLGGGAGNDILIGGAGNDILDGQAGRDTMTGGDGDDIYYVDDAGDVVIELAGGGIDTVRTGFTHTLAANVENLELLWGGNATGVGNALANRITGNTGANSLQGMDGDDILLGMGGNDRLEGGAGADELWGGEGADTFVFRDVWHSRVGAADRIMDFGVGDRLDLSGIDADTRTAGNQGFSLTQSFTRHAGEATLSYDAQTNYTSLFLDVDGDGRADGHILILGNHVNDTAGWLW